MPLHGVNYDRFREPEDDHLAHCGVCEQEIDLTVDEFYETPKHDFVCSDCHEQTSEEETD